jgi:hypothetical protein
MISGMMALMMCTAVVTVRFGVQQVPAIADIHSNRFHPIASSEYRGKQTISGVTVADQGAVSTIPGPDADFDDSESIPASGENEVKTVSQVEAINIERKPVSMMPDEDFSNDIVKDNLPQTEKANNNGLNPHMIESEIPADRFDLHEERALLEVASLDTHAATGSLRTETVPEVEIEAGEGTVREVEDENILGEKVESEPSDGNVRIPIGARIFKWKTIDRRNIIIETYFYGSFKATLTEDCPKLSSKDIAGVEAPFPYAVTETSTILLSNGDECRIQKLIPYAEKKGNVYDVF